jgi:hypothetical protein
MLAIQEEVLLLVFASAAISIYHNEKRATLFWKVQGVVLHVCLCFRGDSGRCLGVEHQAGFRQAMLEGDPAVFEGRPHSCDFVLLVGHFYMQLRQSTVFSKE